MVFVMMIFLPSIRYGMPRSLMIFKALLALVLRNTAPLMDALGMPPSYCISTSYQRAICRITVGTSALSKSNLPFFQAKADSRLAGLTLMWLFLLMAC